MQVSKEMIDEFKELYKEKEGKELDDQKAHEMASNLIGLVEVLYDCAMEDARKKQRLKKEPDGFPVEGQYSCLVCGETINSQTGWYDWYGQTCLRCRRAIKNGDVPAYICTHRDSYFPMWKLTNDLKVKTPTIKKFIKEGKLKARTILNDNGSIHTYIFLKKENPDLIERWNPIRKSYNRHRDKESKKLSREEKLKFKKERSKRRK